MKKIKLLIFFLILLVFLIKPVYAQDDWFSGWKNLVSGQLGPTPDFLVNFLKNFGLPEEILVDWGGIIFYIIIPILTFAIVLKAVMIEEVIVNMMGFRTFEGWKGWVLVLLIVLFLFPTGLVGMFAMWLYAAAGIFVVYGFGALLIINIVKKFIPSGSPRMIFGIFAGVLVCVFLSFFVHFIFAFLIGIIAIATITLKEYRTYKAASEKEIHKDISKFKDWVANEISILFAKYRSDLPIQSRRKYAAAAREIYAFAESYSEKEIRERLKHLEDEMKKEIETLKKRIG
jgi:hypothetical protein